MSPVLHMEVIIAIERAISPCTDGECLLAVLRSRISEMQEGSEEEALHNP